MQEMRLHVKQRVMQGMHPSGGAWSAEWLVLASSVLLHCRVSELHTNGLQSTDGTRKEEIRGRRPGS